MRKACRRKASQGARRGSGRFLAPARTSSRYKENLACVKRGRPSVRCRGYKRIKKRPRVHGIRMLVLRLRPLSRFGAPYWRAVRELGVRPKLQGCAVPLRTA